MNKLAFALTAIVGFAVPAAPALAEIYSPEGTWTTGKKDSRYEVTLCGDGDDMCGKLIWLKKPTEATSRYLDTMVVDTARRIGNQQWRGTAIIEGNRLRGTLTLLDEDTMHIKACNGFVCAETKLYRE